MSLTCRGSRHSSSLPEAQTQWEGETRRWEAQKPEYRLSTEPREDGTGAAGEGTAGRGAHGPVGTRVSEPRKDGAVVADLRRGDLV